tara:strand:- start:2065 stop:2613 length:549 start_codon:yes stop_codon:yes gene_type:complete
MWPSVFVPKKNKFDGTSRYELIAVFEKSSPDVQKLLAAVKAAAEGENIDLKRANPIKNCKADDERREREGLAPRFENLDNAGEYVFIQPWSKTTKPGVVDANINDVIDPNALKDGYHVKLNVNAFAWNKSGRSGISFGLNHVMIVREDERLSTGGASAPRDPKKIWSAPEGKLDDDLLGGFE